MESEIMESENSPIESTVKELPTITENPPNLIKLPGFIDVHVFVQTPHKTFRQSFNNVTAAALAGGFTLICVMPNTCPPVNDEKTLNLFQIYSKETARCDYALYLAAADNTCVYNSELASQTAGLSMFLTDHLICNTKCCYLNPSCRAQHLINMNSWKMHILGWPNRVLGPIVCHAKKYTMAAVMLYAYICKRPIHISDVTTKEEIAIIRAAKDRGLSISCEICPTHLFLCTDDVSAISKISDALKFTFVSPEDQKALWDNLNYIDIFSTHHSPLVQEKNCLTAPYFIPGLEIVLPLLFNAVNEGRLTMDDIVSKFYTNPKKIFNFPDQRDTYILVNMDEEWIVPEETEFSKNTIYTGMKVKGKVHRVVLRGEVAFDRGEILVPEGFGKDIRHKCYSNWKWCMT